MGLDLFAAMNAFVRSVELGSFSRVARELDVKVSTISRHISALETDLGAALFNRSTRALHPTEAGRTFYERAVIVLAGVDEARQATSALNLSPRGLLKVALPSAFGRRIILPHMREFRALYPDIQLDWLLSNVRVDLIEAGIDIAIRIGTLADSSLVARRLTRQRWHLVASRDHLDRNAPLRVPDDIATHPCLLFAQEGGEDIWHYWYGASESRPRRMALTATFRVNDYEAVLLACCQGLGLALLPDWIVGDDVSGGRLVEVLPGTVWSMSETAEASIHAIYPPKKIVSSKVRAFLDFLAERLG